LSTDRGNPSGRVAEHLRAGRGVRRIPYPIGIRQATLLRRTQVTDRMLRLTLGGAGLAGTHTYVADDHVKIVFPGPDGTLVLPVPNDRAMLDWPRPMPPTRCYTIRRHDPAAQELDLDLVLHDGGLASTWAASAAVGSLVAIAGPPGAKAFPYGYARHLMVCDPTGLPAVARWLEEAPPSVRVDVWAVAEHPSQRGYPLEHPGLELRWLDPGEPVVGLVDEALGDPGARAGEVFLFAAGEADLVKPLRRWARDRQVDSSVSGYWKRGVADFDDD